LEEKPKAMSSLDYVPKCPAHRKDGIIDFQELFPDAKFKEEAKECSTPEFWKTYERKSQDPELKRGPMWQPTGAEEELHMLLESAQSREAMANAAEEKRKRMSATIRRLKSRGKTDARCREIVALHLPKGRGPKDPDDVRTFTEQEAKDCKKKYTDEINDPVRRIEKLVVNMRDKRKALLNCRQKLYTVASEPAARAVFVEEISGFGSLLGKVSSM